MWTLVVLMMRLRRLKGTAGARGPSARAWALLRGSPHALQPGRGAGSGALPSSVCPAPGTETGSGRQHPISVHCRRVVTSAPSLLGLQGPHSAASEEECAPGSEWPACQWASDMQNNVFCCRQRSLSAPGVTPGCGAC